VLTLRGRATGRLDAADFELLYQRHAGELLAYLARRTYDPEVAVDLLGETFALAFRDRRQFHGEHLEDARPWLFGVARHRLALYFRRGRVERRALARLRVERRALTPSEYDRIEELAASRELREALSAEFDTLGTEQAGRRGPLLRRGGRRARHQRGKRARSDEPRAEDPARGAGSA
jgi:DNA-directed RNA polymerase specialized sigma24 family protein